MKSLIKKIISITSLIPLIWGFAACSVDATDSKSEPSPKQTVDYFEKLGNFYDWCYGENFGSYKISKDDGKIYCTYYEDECAQDEHSSEILTYSVSGNIASLKGESGTEFAININTKEFVTKKIVFNGNLYIYHTVTLKLSKSDTTPFRTFTIEEGESTKLPDSGIVAPSGSEYRFFGWKNNTGRKVDSNSFSVTSNEELIAIWLAPSGYYKTKYENGFHWEASNLYSKDNPHWKEEDVQYPLSGEISSGEKIINIIQSDESELQKIKEINYEYENDRVYLITIEGYFFSSVLLKSIPIDEGMATITCDFDNNRTLFQAADGYFIEDGCARKLPDCYFKLDEETQQYWCEVK